MPIYWGKREKSSFREYELAGIERYGLGTSFLLKKYRDKWFFRLEKVESQII